MSVTFTRTLISYSDLISDASRACLEPERGLHGLLLIVGTEAQVERFEQDFKERTGGQFPVASITREQYENQKRRGEINGVKYCAIELDRIQVT